MPEIVVKLGNKVVDTHTLFQECIRIGRGRDNDIVIDHLSVSRRHAEIHYDHGHWLVADLDSANGTFVNGQRVTTVPLYHADTITVGKMHLHFFDTPMEQDDQMICDSAEERTMVLSECSDPRGCLTVVKGKQRGKEFILDGERTMIGRSPECDIQLSDWRVAKTHAHVLRRGPRFLIEDLGTWGAIHVNGAPVKETMLREGDLIQIGGTRMTFRLLPSGVRSVPVGSLPLPQADKETVESDDGRGYRLAVSTAADLIKESPPVAEEGEAVLQSWDDPALDEALGSEGDSQELIPAEIAEPADGNGNSDADSTDAEIDHDAGEAAEGVNPEVAMWLQALESERPALRRHAARQLEKLTGVRYET
ncbi:FHA domain-containing protein [Candidatus Sumerlaeota bacterium]|nr:FHA domain-containing protein [Candidatus Sumerlaeota bacterium]